MTNEKSKKLTEKSEKKVTTKIIVNSKNLDEKKALKKAEEKIEKLLDESTDKTDDIETKNLEDLDENMTIKELLELEKKGVRVIFPNLKYAKSKYSNVSGFMKYIESDKPQEGGVKLIIMNFND